jgi:hypothetical protein
MKKKLISREGVKYIIFFHTHIRFTHLLLLCQELKLDKVWGEEQEQGRGEEGWISLNAS